MKMDGVKVDPKFVASFGNSDSAYTAISYASRSTTDFNSGAILHCAALPQEMGSRVFPIQWVTGSLDPLYGPVPSKVPAPPFDSYMTFALLLSFPIQWVTGSLDPLHGPVPSKVLACPFESHTCFVLLLVLFPVGTMRTYSTLAKDCSFRSPSCGNQANMLDPLPRTMQILHILFTVLLMVHPVVHRQAQSVFYVSALCTSESKHNAMNLLVLCLL